jgi:hypothetical protein
VRLLLLLICANLWLAARPARAFDDTTFRSRLSDRGAVLIEGSVSGVWSNDRSGTAYRRHPDYRVTLAPALTYFIADHVGVGADIGLGFERESGHPEDAVALTYDVRRRQTFVGVHSLFEVPISGRTSLLVRLGVGWGRLRHDVTFTGVFPESDDGDSGSGGAFSPLPVVSVRGTVSQELARATLTLPLVFHAAPSIGVGLGPELLVEAVAGVRHSGGLEWTGEAVIPTGMRFRLGVATWIGGSF